MNDEFMNEPMYLLVLFNVQEYTHVLLLRYVCPYVPVQTCGCKQVSMTVANVLQTLYTAHNSSVIL